MSFMGGNTFTYAVSFTATTDEGVAQVKQFEVALDGVKTKADQVSSGWDKTQMSMMRGWQRMLFGVQMGIFYTSMLISSSDSIRTTTLSLEEAQDDYNRTVREYGMYSDEAISAGRRLEKAQIALRRANELTTLSWVGMGLQVINFGIELIKNIPQISAYVAQLWAMATAQAAANPWMAPVIVGAAAAVAGVAAGYMINSTLNYQGGTSKSEMSDFEAAQQARDRQERYDLRRATG